MTDKKELKTRKQLREQLLEHDQIKFVTTIEKHVEEFNKEDGNITCEFATDGEDLDLKMEYTQRFINADINEGKYHIFFCDTCYEHNPMEPFHFIIGATEE